MLKKIIRHIKNNKGDVYIEMLISMLIIMGLFAGMLQMSTAMIQKMWIDNKLTDITKIIAVEGTWDVPEIDVIEEEIMQKMSERGGSEGEIKYHYANKDENYPNLVQIGDPVDVIYEHKDYEVLNIFDKYKMSVDINVSKTAISEVYHKELS
jgi:hypothetical protein